MIGRRRVSERPCPQCATPQPGDARWCGRCGAAMRGEDAEPAARTGRRPTAAPEEPPAEPGRRGRWVAGGALLALLGGLLLAQESVTPASAPAGYTGRGDAAQTGRVSSVTLPAPESEVWRTDVAMPPLLPGGTRPVATTSADGEEVVVVLSPAEEGQRVAVHAVDDGALRWTTMLPLGPQPWSFDVGFGLVAHRTLDSVTLLDLATEQRVWTVEERLKEVTAVTPFGVVGSPAAGPGIALVGLGREDGSVVWRWDHDGAGRLSQIVAGADALVVAGQDDQGPFLASVDPATGAERWLRRGGLPASVPSAPLRLSDEGILVLGEAETITLIDAVSGAEERRTATAVAGDPFGPQQALLRDDVLVTLTFPGVLTATGPDGELWRTTLRNEAVFGLEMADEAPIALLRTDSSAIVVDLDDGTLLGRILVEPDSGGPVVTDTGGLVFTHGDATVERRTVDGTMWRVPTIATHLPDMVTDDGALAVTTPTGVEVHEAADGRLRWAYEAFDEDLVVAGSLGGVGIAAGRVVAAPPETQPPDRGGLFAVFADTGIISWARRSDGIAPRGTPVVANGRVWLPNGSTLLGFEPTAGTRREVVPTQLARAAVATMDDWLVTTTLPLERGNVWVGLVSSGQSTFNAPVRTCAPPVLVDDVVLLSTDIGDLIARNLVDGAQPWGERARGSACRPLTLTDDSFVALVDDRELLAVSLTTGDTVWRVALGGTAAAAPVRVGDDLLVPTLDGMVRAFDGDTGTPSWTYDAGVVAAASIAVDGGTIIVLGRDGTLVGLS